MTPFQPLEAPDAGGEAQTVKLQASLSTSTDKDKAMNNLRRLYIQRPFTDPEKLLQEGVYVSGHVGRGVNLVWYPNGQLHIRCNYNKGRAHGRYQEWLEDGTLAMEIIFRNGKSARVVR